MADESQEEEETNPYLIARAKRIAMIQENLVKLGLTEPLVSAVQREDGNTASTTTASLATKKSISTDISTPGPSSTSASSTSTPPIQKNPRIALQTVDLTRNEDETVIVRRRSPRL